jgi:hypothetical protein
VLNPPSSMNAIHSTWLGAMKDYNDAMDHFAKGVDGVDSAEIDLAAKHLTAGGQKAQAATVLMNEFVAARQ